MRLHYEDNPEELKKFIGMRARLTRYYDYLREGRPIEYCDEIITILPPQDGTNYIRLQWEERTHTHAWAELELDPDGNY